MIIWKHMSKMRKVETDILSVESLFSYNSRGEVASAVIGDHDEAHEYDLAGNSITASYNSITNEYTANSLNQYTLVGRRAPTSPGGPVSLPATYDIDGNLTNCAPWSFTWDSGNRLTTVASNGAQIVAYAYDCLGRRVKKTTSTATTHFFYDGWNLVREIEVSGNITNVVEYVWGKDISGSFQGAGGVGGLLYEKRNGAIYIPYQDAFGNIVGYWDTNGVIVAEYTYDAFGKTISQTGSMADAFRHRFSTKYYDSETGFYYYGYRYYFPELRRWLSRDPIEEEGGNNLYVFCMNSSLSSFDDFGGKASPFKFVGDPRNKSGSHGSYLGLWYPENGIGSLFYSLDIRVQWGKCDDDCKKPDTTEYNFSEQVSFWENEQSRRKDENGNRNIYLDLIDTNMIHPNGFAHKRADGENRSTLASSGLYDWSPGINCTWANISIKIRWRALKGKVPAHFNGNTGNNVTWHEYLEKKKYEYDFLPVNESVLRSGVQTIKLWWSCESSKVDLCSCPKISNGPEREGR